MANNQEKRQKHIESAKRTINTEIEGLSSLLGFFGDAFETVIHERTTLEDFYAEGNLQYEDKTLGRLKAQIGYHNFNYGYDKLVQVDGQQIINRIKGDAISRAPT